MVGVVFMLGEEEQGRVSRTGMGKEQLGRSSGVVRVMVEWSRPSLWAAARRSSFIQSQLLIFGFTVFLP